MLLDRKWYVATTRAGAGQLAMYHLQRQGFEAFLPLVSETRLERGREVVRKLQLFPGYVFVAFDIEKERWRSVNGTIGCGKLIGKSGDGDGMPASLPEGFVEELQGLQRQGKLTAVRAECVVHLYAKGENVKVKMGPWEGHVGQFARYRKGSLVLLMTLFSREFPVTFRPHECEPAAPKLAPEAGAVASLN